MGMDIKGNQAKNTNLNAENGLGTWGLTFYIFWERLLIMEHCKSVYYMWH